jgi:hypothetical protein
MIRGVEVGHPLSPGMFVLLCRGCVAFQCLQRSLGCAFPELTCFASFPLTRVLLCKHLATRDSRLRNLFGILVFGSGCRIHIFSWSSRSPWSTLSRPCRTSLYRKRHRCTRGSHGKNRPPSYRTLELAALYFTMNAGHAIAAHASFPMAANIGSTTPDTNTGHYDQQKQQKTWRSDLRNP